MVLATILGASLAVFIGLTLFLAGGAAILAGRAVGANWKPYWQVIGACLGLTLFERFLNYALFEGDLLGLWGFVLHFTILTAIGLASWRIARVSQFVNQYPWKYVRTSPFSYAEITRI